METKTKTTHTLILHFSLIHFSLILHPSTVFTHLDNHLISCGSIANTTVDNRVFVGHLTKPKSVSLHSGESISLTNPNPSSNSTLLYQTTRVFTKASSYEFEIKKIDANTYRIASMEGGSLYFPKNTHEY
ncbi:hypothetical protein CsSME_00000581 [Camellia sinensis var. sinensis]